MNNDVLTFGDLQEQVLRQIDEEADSGTTLALVKDAINRSHRQLLTERTWPFMLWPTEETLTTVAGTRTYTLKPGVGKLLTLWDTEARCLVPLIPRREWEAMAVDRSTTGVPAGFIYGDWWPVKVQPTSATALRIVSTSAADAHVTATPVQVELSGLDSDGEFISETLNANGTSQVTSSLSFSFVTGVSKIGTWAGTCTLSTADGTTLLTLRASEAGKQYPTIQAVETPNQPRSYTWTATRLPTTLVNDEDVPDTPAPFSAIHVYDALLDMTAYNGELAAKHQQLWQARREALFNALIESVDETIAGGRPRFVRSLSGVMRRTLWNS